MRAKANKHISMFDNSGQTFSFQLRPENEYGSLNDLIFALAIKQIALKWMRLHNKFR